MKTTGKLSIVVLTFLALAASAYAQSPREQLQQMVEQLQKTPSDNALCEKIIKLAPMLKPSPALPPEAERRMARGNAAFQGATSVADYQVAAKEFEQATLAAPWFGDAYYNLGMAQDKAEDYDAALRSLKLAAIAAPGNKDAERLSYAVEFRKEKAANSPEVRAAKQKLKDEALMRSLEGAVFSNMGTANESQYRISNGRAVFWTVRHEPNVCICDGVQGRPPCDGPTGEERMCDLSFSLDGRRGEQRGSKQIVEISENGQTLIYTAPWYPNGQVYKRR